MNLKLAYDKSKEQNLFNDINNLPYELKDMIFVHYIRNVDRVFKTNLWIFFDSMKYYKMSYEKYIIKLVMLELVSKSEFISLIDAK